MTQTPFSISPLPGEMYLTPSIKATLYKLQYVITARQGLGLLLGDWGTGKSTILRRLHGDLSASDDVKVAFITDAETSSTYAFVRSICSAFDVPAKRSLLAQKEAFKDYVFTQATEGFNVVVLLDESQSLDNDQFSILREFLNFEGDKIKLLQMIVCGQLELRNKLKIRQNRAIKSRIVMTAILDSMSLPELREMLKHRCELRGVPFPFPDDVLTRIYEFSGGVPRDALRLCAMSYELAKLYDSTTVSTDLIEAAIQQEESLNIDGEQEEPGEQLTKVAVS